MPDEKAQILFNSLAQRRQRKEKQPSELQAELPSPLPVVEEAKTSETQPEPERRSGRAKGKRSNSDYIQVGAYIPKSLNKQVKRLLLDEENSDFSDLVTQLLQDWVSSKSNN